MDNLKQRKRLFRKTPLTKRETWGWLSWHGMDNEFTIPLKVRYIEKQVRPYPISTSFKEKLRHSHVSMTNRKFHQRFAKQTSSAAVRSDLFVVWYLGLCSKYHLIPDSFLDNPADPQKEHIRSAQTLALGRQTKVRKYSITHCRWKQITNKRHSPIDATTTWKSTTFIQRL